MIALSDVSLTIGDGAFVSLLGPTGCGKSTFLEILAGLQLPTSGSVMINGRPVLEPPSKSQDRYSAKRFPFLPCAANGMLRNRPRHGIAMIFQDYAVFPWMTALRNVMFTLMLSGVSGKEREKRARDFLAAVGLEIEADTYPSRMSGGMRQRLALARALAVDPEIILMDEPFAAVDSLTRQNLLEELLAIWEKRKSTIVLVTHDVDEALFLSDRVYLFSGSPGTIVHAIDINLPRPRLRNSPELSKIRESVLGMLH